MSSVAIYLDRPQNHFTNLDFLTGKVVLQLQSEASVAGIQVKLEAESRTRLAGPRYPHNEHSEKKRTELEVHKLLYKVTDLFPDSALVSNQSNPTTAWTFAPGRYEYKFEFKFPFNNSCNLHNSMLTNLNISGLKVEMAKQANQHVKRTLPPSLSGFPGMADIKYYIKATVVRPQFYKENLRAITNLTFLPIEPPRTGNRKEEAYARRQHQFANGPTPSPKSLFHKSSKSQLKDLSAGALRVSADLRLQNPSILTCNEPIPMRILVSKLSESFETVFLQMLQIELISHTHIQAQDLKRTETGSWVIFSRSNMGIPLGRGGDPAGTEWALDPNMWNRLPLPPSVAPSFQTCNISRGYELEVRVGLAHGTAGKLKSQLIVIPLRVPVRVYSGITPPPALLDAMAAKTETKTETKPKPPTQTPSWPQEEDTERPPMPPRPTAAPPPINPDELHDEAPPSYEDAMAETLSPLEGPRREYYPPDASYNRSPVEPRTGADTKPSVGDGPKSPGDAFYSNQGANSSSESFDMLPSSPPESRSGSPLGSPVARQQSVLKIHKAPLLMDDRVDSPPQYQLVAEGSQPRPAHEQAQQTRTPSRRMNLGVPTRKPVPSPSRTNSQSSNPPPAQ
ncbi:arrestin (or S-antigen), N-terminal domain protein [Aspergillus undulatus]|uniref:arrestin (or S-antigen), N-terminal domain protein n=1 Tax=Aspergillus undulatus TaxID=1810928 RepID=UPI003CCDDA74